MDVYIRKVDGAPCAKQPITRKIWNKSKACRRKETQVVDFPEREEERKGGFKTIGGNLLHLFSRSWGRAKQAHGQRFATFLCFHAFTNHCPHPRCQDNRNSDNGNIWFPGGPPLTYFPIPIADPKRPWGGGPCKQCGDKCAGHYIRSQKHHELFQTHKRQGMKY